MPDLAAKRLVDVLAAGLGILVLAPVLVCLALAVMADSKGPALFRQVRVGRGGRLFTLLKFRTMRHSIAPAEASIGFGGELRITRVGAVLRASKLDELPQLINVLMGEMSLVGPRPEVPSYVALYPARDLQIVLSLRPGLTDFASLRFFDEASLLAAQPDPETYYRRRLMPMKLRLCRFYVRRRTLALDIFVILKTVRLVLGMGRGGRDAFLRR